MGGGLPQTSPCPTQTPSRVSPDWDGLHTGKESTLWGCIFTLRPKRLMETSACLRAPTSAVSPSHQSLTRQPGKGSAPSLSPSHSPSSSEASLPCHSFHGVLQDLNMIFHVQPDAGPRRFVFLFLFVPNLLLCSNWKLIERCTNPARNCFLPCSQVHRSALGVSLENRMGW